MKLLATYYGPDVAKEFGWSTSRLAQVAVDYDLGHLEGGSRRFTAEDLRKLRKIKKKIRMGNPNWQKGRKQPHRKSKN